MRFQRTLMPLLELSLHCTIAICVFPHLGMRSTTIAILTVFLLSLLLSALGKCLTHFCWWMSQKYLLSQLLHINKLVYLMSSLEGSAWKPSLQPTKNHPCSNRTVELFFDVLCKVRFFSVTNSHSCTVSSAVTLDVFLENHCAVHNRAIKTTGLMGEMG